VAPDPPDVGTRVVAARRRAGLTREQLAVETGLSWSAITQIESGRRPNPRAETIASLARALSVTSDYLLSHNGAPRSLLSHHALVHSGLAEFVATAGPFVAAGVGGGESTLVVTTPANADALREHLGSAADAVRFADSESWYASPVAALAGYRTFALSALADGAPWLRLLGEPIWTGRSAAETALWLRYESLINLVFAAFPMTIACPYDESTVAPEIVQQARSAHCTTLADGDIAATADYRDPAELCLGAPPADA